MRSTKSLRLATGALAVGATLFAAPSMASAATCTFDDSLKTLHIDAAPSETVGVVRSGSTLQMISGVNRPSPCPGPRAGSGPATLTNTERIEIGGTQSSEEFVVDESGGAFTGGATAEQAPGVSEVEIFINGRGGRDIFKVRGTPGKDQIKIGSNGQTMLNTDDDVDLNIRFQPETPITFRVEAGDGDDFVSGRGGSPFPGPPAANIPLEIRGGAGNDVLVDGLGVNPQFTTEANDDMSGGPGDDTIFVNDGKPEDIVDGGDGSDQAVADNSPEGGRGGFERFIRTEKVTFLGAATGGGEGPIEIGHLNLAPAVRTVRAGRVTRLKLGWTAPVSWRRLRTITVRLYDGGTPVGTSVIRPGAGRISGKGQVRLVSRASRLSHKGKKVTARLALRIPRSLAGRDLRVAVEATDRSGHKQFENDAGLLRVRR